MLCAEAAYFDGAPVAHVSAYCEHLRLQRIRGIGRRAAARGRPWWRNPFAAGGREAYAFDQGHTEVRRG